MKAFTTRWTLLNLMRQRHFGDDGAGSGSDGEETIPSGAGGDTIPSGSGGDKTFSQADVDKIVSARVNKMNDANRDLIASLTETQTQLGDQDALKEEVERLKQRTLTQEELEREAREKAEKELAADLKAATTSRDAWKTQYENQFVASELRGAMAKHGVDSAMSQMAETYLRTLGTTSYDDKGTPSLTLKVGSLDADKKPVILDLSPDEAVKHLKDGGTMANLFIANNKPGLGGSGAGETGVSNPMNLSMEDYSKLPASERHG